MKRGLLLTIALACTLAAAGCRGTNTCWNGWLFRPGADDACCYPEVGGEGFAPGGFVGGGEYFGGVVEGGGYYGGPVLGDSCSTGGCASGCCPGGVTQGVVPGFAPAPGGMLLQPQPGLELPGPAQTAPVQP